MDDTAPSAPRITVGSPLVMALSKEFTAAADPKPPGGASTNGPALKDADLAPGGADMSYVQKKCAK